MSSPRALSDPFIWFKLEVLCFRPWIRIWSRIFIPLLILDTDSDPVKNGIITPIELLWFWPWISIQSRIFSLLATRSISRIGLCVFKFGFTTYVTLKDVVRAHMASKIRPKARRQTQGRWVVCAYSHSMITLANLIGRTCTPCITLRAPFILLTANPIRLFIIISLRPIHHPVKTPLAASSPSNILSYDLFIQITLNFYKHFIWHSLHWWKSSRVLVLLSMWVNLMEWGKA